MADKNFNEYGIPTCDYKVYAHQRKRKTMESKMEVMERARRCWRRFKLLIKMNKYSKNTFELLIQNAMIKAVEYDEKRKAAEKQDKKLKE